MPSKSQPEKFNIPTSDWLKNWAASTSVSLGVKTVMAPVERIKLLYQAQGELLKSGRLKRPWTSYSDLISRTSQKEGLLSFWKGNATYLGRYTLSSGLALMVKDELLRVDYIGQYNNTYHNDMKDMSLHKNIIYGGLGGLIGMTFAYPLEYTRTRLVNRSFHFRSKSIF